MASRRRRYLEVRLGAFDAVVAAATAVCILSDVPIWMADLDASILTGLHTVMGPLAILMMATHLVWNRRRLGSLLRPTKR